MCCISAGQVFSWTFTAITASRQHTSKSLIQSPLDTLQPAFQAEIASSDACRIPLCNPFKATRASVAPLLRYPDPSIAIGFTCLTSRSCPCSCPASTNLLLALNHRCRILVVVWEQFQLETRLEAADLPEPPAAQQASTRGHRDDRCCDALFNRLLDCNFREVGDANGACSVTARGFRGHSEHKRETNRPVLDALAQIELLG